MENFFSFLKTEGTVRNVQPEMRFIVGRQKRFNASKLSAFRAYGNCVRPAADYDLPTPRHSSIAGSLTKLRTPSGAIREIDCVFRAESEFSAIGLQSNEKAALVWCSCSKAIDVGDLSALGRYLQETKAPEARFFQKLADMLDPRASWRAVPSAEK